ncbi:MAG: metalloregulator ArsR/SmtB family transcription factor [Pseudomonadota bacterium]
MPSRTIAAKELATIFKVVGHPDRVRMIEELRAGEKDVNTLVKSLDLPGPRVSQHLSLLRAHRMVEERRDGRHHFYHLSQPEIAGWITEGLNFVEGRMSVNSTAIAAARELWSTEDTSSEPT